MKLLLTEANTVGQGAASPHSFPGVGFIASLPDAVRRLRAFVEEREA